MTSGKIVLNFFLIFPCTLAIGQEAPESELDSLFVKDHSEMLDVRLFTSTKYNALRIGNKSGGDDLVYRPTNQFNIGVGASYKKFTLNLGTGIPGLTTQRREQFGHSRYLDAQANIFSPERATNLFLQFFKGYGI